MQSLITINREGTVISVDKNFCRLFGYTLDELVGHSVKQIIPSPYKEQHDTYLQNYLKTGKQKIIGSSRVVEAQHKDGSIFAIRITVSKIGEGPEMIFIGMIDKIEDNSASITINSNGLIVACNTIAEEVFGYRQNELAGNSISVIMPENLREAHGHHIQRYIDGGSQRAIGRIRNFNAVAKDGTTFPISLRIEELYVADVRMFRGKIDRVEDVEAVFSLGENGDILAANLFLAMLLGYEKTEVVGKHIQTLIPTITSLNTEQFKMTSADLEPESDREPKRQKLAISAFPSSSDLLQQWKTVGDRLNILHKDGSVIPVAYEMYPIIVRKGEVAAMPVKYCLKIRRSDFPVREREVLTPTKKTIGDYVVVKTVGQGTYGKVKMATHYLTNEKVAIKILLKNNMKREEVERIYREIEILRSLDHFNICKLITVIESEDRLNIVMEYASMTLQTLTDMGPMSETEAQRLFGQIASAVKYCHDLKIIHRDIKHQNILLDEQHNCKLIDFGLSNFMEEGKLRSTFCGTPAFAAPEMILGKKYVGPEVDIWSMGVVLYHSVTGTFPFDNVADIIRASYKDPQNVSPECVNLIKGMLTASEVDRFNIDQIFNHPWLQNTIKSDNTGSAAVPQAVAAVSTAESQPVSQPVGQPQLPKEDEPKNSL